MQQLKFMEPAPLRPDLMTCPHCGESERIGAHSYAERRCKCHACGQTFAESTGTVFYGLHYPVWVVLLVLTLLAYGCPVAAIVVAFMIDERTVAAWQHKAGQHGKQVQEVLVCHGQVELGQVQADELYVKVQGGKLWMATALSVFSRLFLWGEVAARRERGLLKRLFAHVRAAASSTTQAVLIAVDGFRAYPTAILQTFYTKRYTGKRGRPRHLPWPDLHIVQVIKHRQGHKLKTVLRRVVHGSRERVDEIIAMSQVGVGHINTAFIERLNATFRSRSATLVRRTRSLARTTQRVVDEMFWIGVVYNFCTIHTSLQATPAMAAGLTESVWSVEALLRFGGPRKLLHVVS
jgi:transposase-like protein